jgi:hypothetical protein
MALFRIAPDTSMAADAMNSTESSSFVCIILERASYEIMMMVVGI